MHFVPHFFKSFFLPDIQLAGFSRYVFLPRFVAWASQRISTFASLFLLCCIPCSFPASPEANKPLFYNNGFRRDTKVESGNPDIVARVFENYGRNSLIKRLQANRCEWCGAENVPLEVHHVRKLKDLSGRKQWEIAMIGRKRKTMALCVHCHDKLHAGKLD